MRTLRWIAFGCTHAPVQDWSALEWVAHQIEDHKPDVILHLGDLLEADAAARFDNEAEWDLEEEYRQGDKILDFFDEIGGAAHKVFLPGNHDYNISAVNRIPKKLRSLTGWKTHLKSLQHNGGNWEVGAEYLYDRNRGTYRIGQVTFSHGYEAGVSADENQSITLGVPYGLYVGVHTHRPKEVQQAHKNKSTPLPFWFANAGATRDIVDVSYMDRKRRGQWGQGVVVGESFLNLGNVMARNWTAETRVFRMFDEAVEDRLRGF